MEGIDRTELLNTVCVVASEILELPPDEVSAGTSIRGKGFEIFSILEVLETKYQIPLESNSPVAAQQISLNGLCNYVHSRLQGNTPRILETVPKQSEFHA